MASLSPPEEGGSSILLVYRWEERKSQQLSGWSRVTELVNSRQDPGPDLLTSGSGLSHSGSNTSEPEQHMSMRRVWVKIPQKAKSVIRKLGLEEYWGFCNLV